MPYVNERWIGGLFLITLKSRKESRIRKIPKESKTENLKNTIKKERLVLKKKWKD